MGIGNKGSVDILKITMVAAFAAAVLCPAVFVLTYKNKTESVQTEDSYVMRALANRFETQEDPTKYEKATLAVNYFSYYGAIPSEVNSMSAYRNYDENKKYGMSYRLGSSGENGALVFKFDSTHFAEKIYIYASKFSGMDPTITVKVGSVKKQTKITSDYGTTGKKMEMDIGFHAEFTSMSVECESGNQFAIYGMGFFNEIPVDDSKASTISFKGAKTGHKTLDENSTLDALNGASLSGKTVIYNVSEAKNLSLADSTNDSRKCGIVFGNSGLADKGKLKFKLADGRKATKLTFYARPWYPLVDEGTDKTMPLCAMKICDVAEVDVVGTSKVAESVRTFTFSPNTPLAEITLECTAGALTLQQLVITY